MKETKKLINKIGKEPSTKQISNNSSSPVATKTNKVQPIMNENDPSKCIEKPFKELMPNFSLQRILDEKHPHLVNFYELGKIYLTYFECNLSTMPLAMELPYTDFSKQV